VSDEPNGYQTSFPEIIGTKGFLFRESFGTTRSSEQTVELSTYLFSVENVARIVQVCFPKLQVFFSPIFSRSIQALCPVFSRHVSLRYLSDSKRFLYREILPELPTCTREIYDGWRSERVVQMSPSWDNTIPYWEQNIPFEEQNLSFETQMSLFWKQNIPFEEQILFPKTRMRCR